MTGGNTRDQSHPGGRFDVRFQFAEAQVVHGGGPLIAAITDLKTDTVWLKQVVSQGGAPAVVDTVGGASPALPRKRFPATALASLHAKMVKLWDEDPLARIAFMAAGFAHRPLRPYQPGKKPDSPENLATRARRVHESSFGIDGASETERDAYKRARKSEIVSRGALTPYGAGLLETVDAAKTRIVAELGSGEETRWALDSLLDADFSENVLEAAIDDLLADGQIFRREVTCANCGEPHDGLGLVPSPRG